MGTMAKITVVFAFIISLGLVSFAQSGPTLTVEQTLRIERINLINEVAALKKENLGLQQQLTALQVAIERERLKQDVEQKNPGFSWDPSTGKFDPKEPPRGDLR